MADRYPFHKDVVEASIWLDAPVVLEQSILLLIVSASLARVPSVAHVGSSLCFYTPAHIMVLVSPVGYWTKVVRVISSNSPDGL